MNKLEVRKTLVEEGIQASGSQIDRAIEALNLPTDLQPEHVDKLKGYFQATVRPTANSAKGNSVDSQPSQPGFNTIQEQVNSVVAGLKQAELSHAAQAFERLHNQFETDTDRISQAAELLLDPRVKIATGILKAANRINDRQEAVLEIPFGGYDFPLPSIPGVPDFAQFYSSARQEHLLGHGNSSNGSSSTNDSTH